MIRPGLVPPGRSIVDQIVGFLPANFSIVKKQRKDDNILNAFDLDFEKGPHQVLSTKMTFIYEWKRQNIRDRLTATRRRINKRNGPYIRGHGSKAEREKKKEASREKSSQNA